MSNDVWEPEDDAPAAADAMSAAITAVLASVDVDATIKDAVSAAMRRRVQTVAAAAVDELLDDNVLARLRSSADDAAQTALQGGPGPDTYFPNVLAFVTEHLTPMYRRSLSGPDRTWCAEWWRHTEAVSRLQALWRAWGAPAPRPQPRDLRLDARPPRPPHADPASAVSRY